MHRRCGSAPGIQSLPGKQAFALATHLVSEWARQDHANRSERVSLITHGWVTGAPMPGRRGGSDLVGVQHVGLENRLRIGDSEVLGPLVGQGQEATDTARDGILGHRWVGKGT